MAVTKLRGRQTRASEKYDPSGTGLASDSEVEARVLQHSSLFHHNREDVIKLTFDINGNLTDIKTFNNDAEGILLGHSSFVFTNGDLTRIEKKVYLEDGSGLYMHLTKDFTYLNGNLDKIINTKII